MWRLGSRAHRSAKQAFICTACRQNQIIGRAVLPVLATRAAFCAARQRQFSNSISPTDEPNRNETTTDTRPDETIIVKEGKDSGPEATNPEDSAPDSQKTMKKKRNSNKTPTSTANPGPNSGRESEPGGIIKAPLVRVVEPVSRKKRSRKGRGSRVRRVMVQHKLTESDAEAVGREAGVRRVLSKLESPETLAMAVAVAREAIVRRVPSERKPGESNVVAARRRRRLGDLNEDTSQVFTFRPSELKIAIVKPPEGQPRVPPGLKYGLERALFNPGVYHFQDPESKVFNFDPYLAQIMPAEEFDFDALRKYVTSSKDTTLLDLTVKHGKKYTGSTSSMTSALAHFHYLLSGFRPLNYEMLSHGFMSTVQVSNQVTRFNRGPVGTFLHWKDGAYAIDADKEFDSETVLSQLGRSMEKLLTLDKEDYEKYRKSNAEKLSNGAPDEEAFHYSSMGDFLMRSQLDALDRRLPGSGMFDLKTRAVVSIRMNVHNYKQGQDYEIRHRFGEWESFEREYYDMIRAAFLKYSLQARMGRMTGIFVAFHNTKRIFGFQYIPLSEMDCAIHGAKHYQLGDGEFRASIHLLNAVLDKATARFPQRTLRLFFEARPTDPPFLYVFARPVTDEEVARVQKDEQDRAERIVQKMEENTVTDEETAEVQKDAQDQAAELAQEVEAKVVMDEEVAEAQQKMYDETDAAVQEMEIHERPLAAVSKRRLWNTIVGWLFRKQGYRVSRGKGRIVQPRLVYEIDLAMKGRLTYLFGKPGNQLRDALVKALARPLGPHRETGTTQVVDYVTQALEPGQFAWCAAKGAGQDSLAELAWRVFASSHSEDRPHKRLEDERVEDPWLQEVEKALAKFVTSRQPPTEDAELPPPTEDGELPPTEDEELLGLIVSVRHKINGVDVDRPNNLHHSDVWDIDYSIKEMPLKTARHRYESMRKRRVEMYSLNRKKEGGDEWFTRFRKTLRSYSEKGAGYRKVHMRRAMKRPVHVLGFKKALHPVSVFQPVKPASPYKPWRGPLKRRPRSSARRKGGQRKDGQDGVLKEKNAPDTLKNGEAAELKEPDAREDGARLKDGEVAKEKVSR